MKLTPLDNKLFCINTDKAFLTAFISKISAPAYKLSMDKPEATEEELIKSLDYGLTNACNTGKERVYVDRFPESFLLLSFRNKPVVLHYFSYLFNQHEYDKRKLEDMTWGYREVKENLHNAAKRIRRGTFSKYDRSDIFKNFIGTLLSAVVFCLSLFFMDGGLEKLVDRVEWGYNIEGFLMMLDSLLRFGSWFVLFIAGAATLIFLFCTIGAISNARKADTTT